MDRDRPRFRRIFLALWPDEQTRHRFLDIQQQLQQQRQLQSARPVAQQNIHMTLHFLGSVAENVVDELIDAMNRVQVSSFELIINQVGCFARAKVLWLGVEEMPAELLSLVRQTGQYVSRCVEAYDPKPFSPHVTLFRKARYQGEMMTIEPVSWKVNSFALVESSTRPEGVEYTVLKQWPLS